jgi:hypothetical protein
MEGEACHSRWAPTDFDDDIKNLKVGKDRKMTPKFNRKEESSLSMLDSTGCKRSALLRFCRHAADQPSNNVREKRKLAGNDLQRFSTLVMRPALQSKSTS